MPQATMYQHPAEIIDFTPVAAHVAGEMVHLPDGRAGMAVDAIAAGTKGAVQIKGIALLTKTADLVWVDGVPIYWDASANSAILYPASDEDYCIGVAYGDATAAATSGYVNLNVIPRYKIDLAVDEFLGVIVKTVVGSTTVEVPHYRQFGGTTSMFLGTTAEAQKLDLLSQQGFAVGSDWIVEGGVNIVTNSDNAAGDFNIGVANATHATDADAITEHVFLHTDGAALSIHTQSKDGTTTVTADDTDVDFVAGTPFHFVIDGRNPADIQIYINGVLVNTAAAFRLDGATGPLKLLAHLEKTSDDSPGDYRINYLRVRTMDL